MIKIILADGDVFEAATSKDMVTQLKLDDWTKYSSNIEYQNNINRRVMVFKNEKLNFNNEDEFLDELNRIGFIKEIIKTEGGK